VGKLDELPYRLQRGTDDDQQVKFDGPLGRKRSGPKRDTLARRKREVFGRFANIYKNF
jgi:hypothetical protein